MMSAGTVITGAVVSRTVTLNEQVATFPLESVAVTVTFVVPIANQLPDAALYVTFGAGSQRSETDAKNDTGDPSALQASAVTSDGQTIVGGVLSLPFGLLGGGRPASAAG